MNMPRLVTIFCLSAIGVVAVAGAASAASAYTSDKISIFEQPRNRSNEIIGLLPAGESVTIDRCTASGNWCRVFSSGPTGWIPASYIIGAAAKNDATPLRSLASPPFSDQRDLPQTRRNLW